MTSFKKLMERQAEMVGRLVHYSELDYDLVDKVVQYAKNLVQVGTNDITDNTFMAQMICRFQLTNQIMVNRMFEVLLRRARIATGNEHTAPKIRTITLEDYCVCICTFLTKNLNIKVDWVFAVYDSNDDGFLSRYDLYIALKPCVLHTEDMDTEEATKDLVEIVMSVFDLDKNGAVDLEEFRILVKHNVLYIDLLGQCLPGESVLNSFLWTIKSMTAMEVAKMFQEELDKGLVIPAIPPENSLYPIRLDLP